MATTASNEGQIKMVGRRGGGEANNGRGGLKFLIGVLERAIFDPVASLIAVEAGVPFHYRVQVQIFDDYTEESHSRG